MGEKFNINIVNRKFEIDVDEEFAPFLKSRISEDFNTEANNDIKTLLQAYIKRNHELFMQEQKVESILKKTDNL